MTKKLNDLRDLLQHELKDLYSAEHQLTKALPKMAKAAKDQKLKSAFEEHLKQTENQIKRLERVSSDLDFELKGEDCEAMKGLVKEGDEMIEKKAKDAVHDAGLIAAAQRVEHYEMAGYGTAIRYLQMLKHDEAARILSETLDEEKKTDEKLTKLAEEINSRAMA